MKLNSQMVLEFRLKNVYVCEIQLVLVYNYIWKFQSYSFQQFNKRTDLALKGLKYFRYCKINKKIYQKYSPTCVQNVIKLAQDLYYMCIKKYKVIIVGFRHYQICVLILTFLCEKFPNSQIFVSNKYHLYHQFPSWRHISCAKTKTHQSIA